MPTELVREWKELMAEYDLMDVYRERNPGKKCFTFAPNGLNPHKVFRRLDYIFASEDLSSMTTNTGIVRVLDELDHKGVTITISMEEGNKGPGNWRHEDELLNNEE